MRKCFYTSICAFFLVMAPGAHAALAQSILYNHIDVTNGVLSTRLAAIKPDGSSDVVIDWPLRNPAYAAWSPDGQALATAGSDPARPFKLSTDVYLLRLREGDYLKLSSFEDTAGASGFATFYPSYLAVSQDGKRVAAGMVSYIGARGTSVETNEFGNPISAYEPTSKISRCVSLMVFKTDGSAPFLVGTPLCDDDFAHPGEGVDWSPRTNLIAYPLNTLTVFGGAGGLLNITAIHLIEPTQNAADQGRHRQLTFPSGTTGFPFDPISVTWSDDFAPAFSKDGSEVAYVRCATLLPSGAAAPAGAIPSIRIIGVDGRNDREIIRFEQGSYVTRISWSPDGKQLVFDLGKQATRSGFPLRTVDLSTVTLARINTDGTGFAQVRGASAIWPQWQPEPVTSSAPTLAITVIPGEKSLRFAWSDPSGAFVLESSSTIAPGADWTAVGGEPVLAADKSSLIVEMPTVARSFYRLRRR